MRRERKRNGKIRRAERKRKKIENVARKMDEETKSSKIQRVERERRELENFAPFSYIPISVRSVPNAETGVRNRIDVRAQRGGATWPGIVIMKEYRGKVGRHESIKSREGEEVCAHPRMHAISAVDPKVFPKEKGGEELVGRGS